MAMRQPIQNFHSLLSIWALTAAFVLATGSGALAQETAGRDDAAPAPTSQPDKPLSDQEDMDRLFAELAQLEGQGWRRAESDILRIWSRSGSAAMDLLYQRGEGALDEGDTASAIGHLTALTDHAPDFAAGWQLRAAAFYADGEFGPAISDIARTLKLESRHFAALTQLGVMLEELGRDDRALQAYRESLAINPHQQDASDAVARLEQKSKGTDA